MTKSYHCHTDIQTSPVIEVAGREYVSADVYKEVSGYSNDQLGNARANGLPWVFHGNGKDRYYNLADCKKWHLGGQVACTHIKNTENMAGKPLRTH